MGDQFLKDIQDLLFAIRHAGALKKPKIIPYVFQQFNVRVFYPNDGISNVICRFINALVDALNNHAHLPKFILIIPYRDILAGVYRESGMSIMTGAAIHALIKQMNMYIDRRRTDLDTNLDTNVEKT